MGCVHIYCGDGKGKTTAALGLASRMAGSGGQVVLARFLKNDDSGEVKVLRQIEGILMLPSEKTFGFTWQMTEAQKREAGEYYTGLLNRAFETAAGKAVAGEGDQGKPGILLILDEICAAVGTGLVKEEALLSLLDSRPERLEVVLTGRDPSDALMARADYVSEILKVKHPFDQGLPARRGIEY